MTYLFLYPVGHLGFTAVTFFEVLPLTQVMEVILLTIGAAEGSGLGDVVIFLA
jgi:hypothetical protein